MALWIVLIGVGLVLALAAAYGFQRARRAGSPADIAARIREIEAAGIAAPPEEVDRQVGAAVREILASPAPAAKPALPRFRLNAMMVGGLALAALVVVVVASALTAPEPAPETATPVADNPHSGADVPAMIAELEAKVRKSSKDPEGWRMLAWSYFQTGRFAEAAEAYGKAAALTSGRADYLSAQGESLVQATQGKVTPEAETVFRRALAGDSADYRARYFLAVAKDQRGEHDAAMNDWIALLNSAPAGAPWASQVREFVERTAAERKVDLAGRLKAAPDPALARGPTAQDIAEAADMTEAERKEMIGGMVERLAERLAEEPNDRAGWIQLMRVRMVQGDRAGATAAYRDARRAFSGSPADQAALREAAGELGVPGV